MNLQQIDLPGPIYSYADLKELERLGREMRSQAIVELFQNLIRRIRLPSFAMQERKSLLLNGSPIATH